MLKKILICLIVMAILPPVAFAPTQDKTMKLQQGDYVNYQWRLFVTGDVLKQMGLQDFSVMPMDTLGENHV